MVFKGLIKPRMIAFSPIRDVCGPDGSRTRVQIILHKKIVHVSYFIFCCRFQHIQFDILANKGYWITRSTTQFQGLRTRLSHHFVLKEQRNLNNCKRTCLRLISIYFCFQAHYQTPDLKEINQFKPLRLRSHSFAIVSI